MHQLKKHFSEFEIAALTNSLTNHLQENPGTHMNADLTNLIVSPDKLKWVIFTFQPYIAPGPDSVYPITQQK